VWLQTKNTTSDPTFRPAHLGVVWVEVEDNPFESRAGWLFIFSFSFLCCTVANEKHNLRPSVSTYSPRGSLGRGSMVTCSGRGCFCLFIFSCFFFSFLCCMVANEKRNLRPSISTHSPRGSFGRGSSVTCSSRGRECFLFVYCFLFLFYVA